MYNVYVKYTYTGASSLKYAINIYYVVLIYSVWL